MIEWHIVFLALYVLCLSEQEQQEKKLLHENNSIVEVLPKPCDTKVDRSS